MTSSTTKTSTNITYREQLKDAEVFYNGTIYAVQSEPNILYKVVHFENGKYICDGTDITTGKVIKTRKLAPKTLRFNVANSERVAYRMQDKLNDLLIQQNAETLAQNIIDMNAELEAAIEAETTIINEVSEEPELPVMYSHELGYFIPRGTTEDEVLEMMMSKNASDVILDDFIIVVERDNGDIEQISLSHSIQSNEPTSIPHIEGESLSDFFVRAEQSMSESEKAAMTTEYEESLSQQEMIENNQTSNADSTSDLDIERLNSEPAKQTMRIGGTVDTMTGQVLIDTMQKLDISKNEALSMAITLLGSASKEQLRDALGYVYAKRLATIFED